MSFLNISDVANSPHFRARVMVALVKAAAAVASENTSTMNPARAEKRRTLARTVVQGPEMQVNLWIWVMLSDTNIATKGLDATDAELAARAAAAFDIMAGVTVAEQAPLP